ncbi:MAG: efflux RND transporter periplasmic adaptor subunit [Bryobacteraceae bacterium]|nr:efflux RND transporter periplasmic adaptor subunit [Bryobacteraceae bacterium]
MLKRILLILIPLLLLLGWLLTRGTPPPEVGYTQPTRETIVSTLTTNGRVDPFEWAAIYAESAGPVLQVHVTRGQNVRKGEILATVGSAQAQTELSSAQSRVNGAQAELETVRAGGRATELAEIESNLQRARAELASGQTEVTALERLAAKNAATQADLTAAKTAVRQAQSQIEASERRRAALVTQADRQIAEARLSEAQAGVAAAGRRIAESVVRSPVDGVVYALDIRPGAYVQPGSAIARIGKLDRVRVTVFVDEPELGRIGKNMPVAITWDALPAREWKGEVESVPLQIVPFGTRQVGEVICVIENPDMTLIPGTNVNAEIRSKEVASALTLPKEVLRREGNETGVLKIVDEKVLWQKVKLGVASVTRFQILEGVREGEKIALPTEISLKTGDKVKPVARI